MERSAFLARVEAALGSSPDNLAHPIPKAPAAIPSLVFLRPMSDLSSDFVGSATAAGAEVHIVADRAALVPLLDEIVRREEITSAVVSTDPETAEIDGVLRTLGIAVVPLDARAEVTRAGLGVTGASGAIARTGSVIVDAGRAGGRSASLLPPVHLAIVPADSIVETTSDWWRNMRSHHPDGPPSQLVFITGPSRSADIEQTYTVGVHGPGRLYIAVVGQS